MNEFKKYHRRGLTLMRPYIVGEVLPINISISEADMRAGCPKEGDYIARSSTNSADMWLVNSSYFASQQYEVVE
jgi:hypothetical protein